MLNKSPGKLIPIAGTIFVGMGLLGVMKLAGATFNHIIAAAATVAEGTWANFAPMIPWLSSMLEIIATLSLLMTGTALVVIYIMLKYFPNDLENQLNDTHRGCHAYNGDAGALSVYVTGNLVGLIIIPMATLVSLAIFQSFMITISMPPLHNLGVFAVVSALIILAGLAILLAITKAARQEFVNYVVSKYVNQRS